MQKHFFLASLVFSGLFITDGYAQDASTSPVMSRDENSQAIGKIHSDSQKEFLDKAKQIMKSGPEMVQPPPATDDDSADTNSTKSAAPTQIRPSQPAIKPQAPAVVNPTPNFGPPPAPAQQAPAPAQDNSQPYSGFGTGESNQATPGGNTNSGGTTTGKDSNWNMGY